MNRATKQEKEIEQWMLAVIKDGGIERYDDLHIDQIDPRWADREFWVSGALEAFKIATRLRDRHLLQLTISVAFSLKDGRKVIGMNLRTLKALEKKMSWMPPSLYLFKSGTEPWNHPSAVAVSDRTQYTSIQADASMLFGGQIPAKACFYIEFARENSKDYGRSLFLVS